MAIIDYHCETLYLDNFSMETRAGLPIRLVRLKSRALRSSGGPEKKKGKQINFPIKKFINKVFFPQK